jgi:hypothetical protein
MFGKKTEIVRLNSLLSQKALETNNFLTQSLMHLSECTDTFGLHCRFTRGDEVYLMKKEYKMVKEKKFVCSLDLLLQIFQSRCQTPGCTAESQIQYHFIGVTVVINSVCSEGHKYRFCSSPQVNDIYANNLQAATSLMFSGKFFNLEFLASFLIWSSCQVPPTTDFKDYTLFYE